MPWQREPCGPLNPPHTVIYHSAAKTVSQNNSCCLQGRGAALNLAPGPSASRAGGRSAGTARERGRRPGQTGRHARASRPRAVLSHSCCSSKDVRSASVWRQEAGRLTLHTPKRTCRMWLWGRRLAVPARVASSLRDGEQLRGHVAPLADRCCFCEQLWFLVSRCFSCLFWKEHTMLLY